MATVLGHLDFKQNYPIYGQGLFIVTQEKRLPKGQETINVGKALSDRLIDYRKEERKEHLQSAMASLLEQFNAVSLTHIEILFTPYLELDPIRLLASFSRNRRICVLWPGIIDGKKVIYAEHDVPEYYENDLAQLQETYIING